MRKILVTGGTGYIGSHTAVELQQHGFEVLIADNLSNSCVEVLDNIRKITGVRPLFEKIDLADRGATLDFFSRNGGLAGVIHFAAFKAVGESMEKPLEYYRNNVGSMLNILESMQLHGIPHLVFSSSCTVYGQPDQLPVTEEAPVKPAWSPYGNTKQMCEEILRFSTRILPVRGISLRYFNPAGAHESALIGELPIGIPNNLVPYITQTAIGKREYLRVFGNDYDTPDGTAIRDFIHVTDLAKAHVVAINRMLDGRMRTPLELFNLGTGKGYSVLEVIHAFEKVSGRKLNFRFHPRRPGDTEKMWADTRFANEELGWKAERDIDQMMASAWAWERKLSESALSLPSDRSAH